MAFADFKYPGVVQEFGLTWHTTLDMFAGVPSVTPSATFQQGIAVAESLAETVNTEKARSEWLVAPLLVDFWSRYRGHISLFSGSDFQADPGAKLTGYCDFLIGRAPQRPDISAPVVVICEAKKDNPDDGLGQCIAGMVGAQRFNQRENSPVDPIYGCLTTGSDWRFLRLSGTTLEFDMKQYKLFQADRILGILIHIVGPPPAQVAA